MNKTLLQIKGRFPKLLEPHKFIRSKNFLSSKSSRTLYKTLSKENLKHCEATSCRVPFLFYSSVTSEEKVIQRYSDSVISVPSLQFEDIEFEQPVSHSDLCIALKSCNSFEEQLFALNSTLALSPDEVEKRLKFCNVIESLFRPFFGEIKIQIFGSTVNGFGFKGCDIDMSFETFAEKKPEIYLECPDVPLVSEVMCGKVTPQEISMLPRKEQLLFIHTVLLEFYKESVEPTIFINAYIPLVRFYHDKYNLKCDLSCSNRVAFANTKLLYLFQKLDERVIPLMMTIRYWAKHVELIGKGLLFNTYTISLLVIHFLQTRNSPVLPSAKHILSISDSLEVTDMNDTSFLEIQKFVPPSENTQTLAELMRDFFFFYLYFDFTRVICPLIGGSIPREKFFSNLPNRKFRMNTVCVQDPMLESHNVADLVDYKTCKKFISEVMSVCKILQDSSNLAPSPSKWGLLTLLDKSDEYLSYNMISEQNVLFTIPLFNKPIISKFVNEDNNLMTAKTLLHLLQHILLFECNTLEMSDVEKMLKSYDETVERQRKILESADQMNSEMQELSRRYRNLPKTKQILKSKETPMLDDFKKINAEHTLILCAECKVLKNIWLGRDFVSVESLPSNSANDLIEKEHYVSTSAAKQNEMNAMDVKTKPVTFIYECYLSSKDLESTLLVNFRPFQKTNFNPILGIFLKEYIPKLIKDLNGNC